MADDDQPPAGGDDGLSKHDHVALAAAHGDAIHAHADSMLSHLAAISPGPDGEDAPAGPPAMPAATAPGPASQRRLQLPSARSAPVSAQERGGRFASGSGAARALRQATGGRKGG